MSPSTLIVEWGGRTVEGFWWAEHGAVHVVCDLGARSCELAGPTPPPAVVARGLLIALAAESQERASRPWRQQAPMA